jgi:hypothetical protein
MECYRFQLVGIFLMSLMSKSIELIDQQSSIDDIIQEPRGALRLHLHDFVKTIKSMECYYYYYYNRQDFE